MAAYCALVTKDVGALSDTAIIRPSVRFSLRPSVYLSHAIEQKQTKTVRFRPMVARKLKLHAVSRTHQLA